MDHVGQALRPGERGRVRAGEPRERPGLPVQRERAGPVRGKPAGDRGVGDDDAGARVLQHECGARGGIGRVQGDVRPARLEHRQQGDGQLRRAREEDGHRRLRPHAHPAERVRQPVGARVQLREGDALAPAHERDRAGAERRLRLEEGVDEVGGHGATITARAGGEQRPGRLIGTPRPPTLVAPPPIRRPARMTDLQDRLAALSDAKRALLEQLRAGAPGPAPIPRVPEGPAPLSPEQRRLWFLIQLAPEHPVYTIPLGLRLRGPLDAEALAGALRDLVARHETLRTAFRESAGEPAQTVGDGSAFAPEVVELRGDPWAEAEANYRTDAFAREGFGLERGETFRALLLREADDEHRLLLGIHHLAADGWSAAVLLRELSALYAARAEGVPARLPELPLRFRDWAAWRGRDHPAARAADEAHWRAELAGAPPVLELPADRPRPPVQGWEGAKHPFELPAPLAAAVRELSRREGTTPFTVLAAAFALLLGRQAGEDDLLLGTAVANRPRPELAPLVGFFANTLPLRVRLDGAPTVRELLRRVHRAATGAHAHAGLPFDRIVELAGVRRDFSRPPLVQAVIGFAESPAFALSLPGVTAEPLHLDSRTAPFELSLQVEARGDALPAALQYDTGLFDPETAARMVRQLETLLAAFAADPGRRAASVPLATPAELRAVLAWGRPASPAAASVPVHWLFEARARAAPHAPAVLEPGGAVSYGELDARAERVARALRGRVRPETRVAVCAASSADLIAAVLGVFRAGAALVPLDPAYPADRLRSMLEDSGARVLLSGEGASGAFEGFGGEVLPLDGGPAGGPHPAALEPPPSPTGGGGWRARGEPGGGDVSPDGLAYVVYTSGSTGTPKGVLVTHRSLAATLGACLDAFGFGPGDEVPALASFAFDIWLFEALLPLLAGAAVRPVARERVLEVDRLVEELEGATFLHAVPALMREVARAVRASRGRALPRLRQVLVGGDAVRPDLLGEMREAFPAAEIRVGYGPTEAAIICALHPAEGEDAGGRHLIGRPLGSAALHVLDADGGLLPPGVPGELYVGGPGVARGYLGRPGLTAERFVPDPFGGPGARLYRTGDRARWSVRGVLEFLGREDRQVKVRGYRVEPGEVEAALSAHPGVRDAVVAVRDDAAGEKRLVGYVVPAGDGFAVAELRARLAGRLPAHMVPSAVVVLDALPLTPTGKIDRGALPPPAAGDAEAYVEPRTPTERALAGIWAEVLRVERVGARDDFFELGGQSILAVRLLARVRAELDTDVPVAGLLQAPTLEAMARAVDGRRHAVGLPLVALQPFGEKPPLFLVHPAGGHVVCYRDLAVHLAPDQPVYGIQARGIEDGEAPLPGVEAMAACYLEAVRAFRPAGPYRLGGWSFGGSVAWEMARLLDAGGEEVELLALVDTGPHTGSLAVDPYDSGEVAWQTVAALAGLPAASRMEVDDIRGLEPREQVLALIRRVDAPHLLPESRADEVLGLMAVRYASLRAQAEYRPGPFPGRLDYVRTTGSTHTRLHAPGLDFWRALAEGGTVVHPVPGSHGSVLQEPHVARVAAALRSAAG